MPQSDGNAAVSNDKYRFLIGLLIGTLSASALFLATPPLNFSWLTLFAFLPLFWQLHQSHRGWWFNGWWFSFVYHLLTVYWISYNSGTDPKLAFYSYLAMVVFLSMRFSLLFLVAGWIAKRRSTTIGLLFLAMTYPAWEWLLSLGELGFPWAVNALSLIGLPFTFSLVPVGGMWLLSLYAIAVNLLLYFAIIRRDLRFGIAVIIVAVSPALIPVPSPDTLKTFRIGVVQPDIDPAGKWADHPIVTVDRAYEASRAILPQRPDLIIWPETAIPFYLQARAGHRERVLDLIDSLGVPVVSGAQHYEQMNSDTKTYNAVFVIYPRHQGGIDPAYYAKRWLVPLGERIPFQWLFPSLHGIDLGQAEFSVGERMSPLEVKTINGSLKIGTPVCYESVFPQMGNMFADHGVQLLANVTNDGWYERTNEKSQHAELFRFRALEIGVPLVRSANTGLSGWMDARGRWQDRMKDTIQTSGVYDIAVPASAHRRTGSYPWVPLVCLAGAIVVVIRGKGQAA